MTFKLSPSSLSLFNECPRCFWLDKHDKWKRPSGPFPSLPAGMDRILKSHFDKFRDKGELPPEIRDHANCKGMLLFGRTDAEKELLKEWRNNFKGIRWTDKVGNVLFGAVDNLLVCEDKLVVLDYKTRGYPCKEDTHEHYQHQMDIYCFLLEKNGYKVENHAFLLFYHPSHVLENGDVVFNTDLIKIKTNQKHAHELFENAIKTLEGECPNKTCEWCEKV